jgi:hypothetical protein
MYFRTNTELCINGAMLLFIFSLLFAGQSKHIWTRWTPVTLGAFAIIYDIAWTK